MIKKSNVTSCAMISSQAFSLFNFRGSLISELVSKGIVVYALAPDFDSSSKHQVESLGAIPISFQLSRTGINPVWDLICTIRLTHLLRRLKPDVSLGYFVKPVIFGTIASWLAGVPRRIAMIEGLGYVFTASSEKESKSRFFLRSIVGKLYRFALSKASKAVFLNSDDIHEFTKAALVSQDKTFKLGGIGVNLSSWPLTPAIKSPISFVMVARLLKEKGVFEFVEAAKLVKEKHPGVRFVLLGGLDSNPGSLEESEIQDWVKKEIVEWPGHVEVKPWLAQSSVFVLPSYREGVPRSTQEAMAMGKPIITTDVPGCRETVEDGINGFLVPVRNSQALADAMERFILNPALIEPMGLKSRQIAEERFDDKVINARLLKLMEIV